MPAKRARPVILVLAGVDGAGKSSVGGALLDKHSLERFNPDAFSQERVRNSARHCSTEEGRPPSGSRSPSNPTTPWTPIWRRPRGKVVSGCSLGVATSH
jgi:hypothetical protein